jgi:uroporphyrinogen III methyltransferase/synthase
MMSEAAPLAGPLAGRRIVVTRAQAQAGDLVAQLMALGATPLECPAIAIAPPESYDGLDAALDRISGYDWIIFTSVNGVAAVLARLSDRGQDRAVLHGVRIGAIGPATAQALAAAGVPPQFVPATYVAEAIVAQIADVAGQHILLPRADIARAALGAGLRGRGALVDEVTAYRTVSAPGLAAIADLLRVGSVDALTFTSSSTVRFFLEGLAVSGITPADLQREPGRPAVICIGPITADTAQAQGLVVDAVAEEYTTGGLIAALLRWFAGAA